MILVVGIDVAKDKHDCFIQSVDGKFLSERIFCLSCLPRILLYQHSKDFFRYIFSVVDPQKDPLKFLLQMN